MKFICMKFGANWPMGVSEWTKNHFCYYGTEWEKKFQNGVNLDLDKNSKIGVVNKLHIGLSLLIAEMVRQNDTWFDKNAKNTDYLLFKTVIPRY